MQRFNGIGILIALIVLAWSCSGNNRNNDVPGENGTRVESEFAAGDTLEMTGSLVCAHCYALNPENTGHDHELPQSGFREDCAEFCSLQGYPIGVLLGSEVDGSNVWVIRTASQIFADYMTRTVKVQGTYVSQGVIEPLGIELKEKDSDNWITIM